MARLDREFFLQDTVEAAKKLLGCCLVRVDGGETMVCRITETEAYVGAVDKACHAYGGRRTPRTETLYAGPGTCYVYLIYGMYHCLNFVTGPEDTASAVLIRGCAPVYHTDAVARRRFGVQAAEMTAYQRKNFLNGPGKLCKGLSIDRSLNALPLGNGLLYLADGVPELGLEPRRPVLPFRTGRRIGIDYAEEAAEFPWRFTAAAGFDS
ncbi:MAG: DNA-3-methyladenine glycosylase [Oscillospiraceae bacterium]|nr:DNA-3-methyladenine glycosylase [Oscillospiraceae bacterium]MCI9316511.1 DNA-3-methyladenine glycosylase [Oscillospiraceae bacterium]